jgi:tetratricopeptide (TPR) repeat protein
LLNRNAAKIYGSEDGDSKAVISQVIVRSEGFDRHAAFACSRPPKALTSGCGRRNRMNRIFSIAGFVLLCVAAVPAQSPPGRSVSPDSSGVVANPHVDISELARSNRWKEVAALADRNHRQKPEDPTALYWLGISRLKLHEPVGSVQAFRAAEKLGLNTALSHEGLGLGYYDLNQFFLFEEQMKKAAALDPRDSTPYFYLGLYRWTIRSDAAGALEFFDKALQLHPDDWKSLYQAGNCFEHLGKLDEARDRYAKAITLVEKNRDAFGWPYQGMARLLLDEKPEAALEFAKKAVSLQPDEYSNHVILAKVYERLGNLPDAIREAESATTRNPNDSTSRYALYKLYRQAGDPRAAQALKEFQEVKMLYDRD